MPCTLTPARMKCLRKWQTRPLLRMWERIEADLCWNGKASPSAFNRKNYSGKPACAHSGLSVRPAVPSIGAAAACAAALISAWGRATLLPRQQLLQPKAGRLAAARPQQPILEHLKDCRWQSRGSAVLAAALLDCSTVNCIMTTEEAAGTNSFLAKTTHDHAMRMEPDKDPASASASPHSG